MESCIQMDIVSHRQWWRQEAGRGEGQCQGMILPIFGLILVRMCSAVCRGVRPFSHPLEAGLGRARRCTLDARADYHLNVPTGGQPLWALVTLTAPTYLSKGEIHLPPSHPLFVDDRLFHDDAAPGRVVVEICQHLLLPLNFFPRSFPFGRQPVSLVRKIDRIGRRIGRKKNWSNWSNWWCEQFTPKKVDTSNRLSPRGVPTLSRASLYFLATWHICRFSGIVFKRRQMMTRTGKG